MKRFFLLFFTVTAVVFAPPRVEPTEEEVYKKLQEVLKKQTGPFAKRTISRVGNKTIEFEAFISTEADETLLPPILSDFKNYPNWAIKNINQKPSGGNYYVKLKDVKSDPKDDSIIHGLISIDLPVFHSQLVGFFKLSSENKAPVYTLRAKMVPATNSILESATAVLKAFPAENRPGYKWLYVRADIFLKNWLLYEALPDKLLRKESGERVQIVLDNYSDEEERLKSSQIPTRKMEVRDSQSPQHSRK